MTSLTKWTGEDYHRMIDAGIIKYRKVELINGEIINIIPEGPVHRFINHRKISVSGKPPSFKRWMETTGADFNA
ncbi:MAG: hypothetical protein F6K22_33135 [Okeania sp. SIO2F4]|uniref:hypothetical protein n=1 Tax=Okeania sp. SIO2F4 TaxID=2607790 RepID=UPI00142C91AD|nr:hypothetical protein [Okeania sp. SIO2F4]NES07215.1 hypothetical protein [Okeania sp. SIO2F4]